MRPRETSFSKASQVAVVLNSGIVGMTFEVLASMACWGCLRSAWTTEPTGRKSAPTTCYRWTLFLSGMPE